MKIGTFGKSLLLFAAAVIFGGCASTAPQPASEADAALNEGIATGEAMLAAFRDDDASAFLKQLPENVAERFGKKEFATARRNMKETMGDLESYQFLCPLEMPLEGPEGKTPTLHPLIWKTRFLRKTASGRDVYQETLFRVVVGRLDGKPYVLSFGFL